ncbi:MAG: protein kinase [Gammaproteobacteria bacterium]|nr:protein kinase [Gammaproteobacteria bacterium]
MSEQTEKQAGKHQKIHTVELGENIDGFHVDELIHESFTNMLYGVSHPDHDAPMVMKVPKLGVFLPPSAYAGFETEVRILSRLHGVYTPRVIATGDLSSCPYLVTEYIEGDELVQATKNAPVAVDRLCDIMVPVCKAVHELHRHNLIHLDIKPGNIRNRKEGQVVILDFGVAHHTRMPDMYENPHEDVPHTLDYVAPEQLHNVRTESRSDVYALGVILYVLATGHFPFGKANPITVKKRLFMPPTPPRVHNESLPPWLQEIILKCLARRPDDRFDTAKQIAYALSHPNMVSLGKNAQLICKPGFLKIAQAWLSSRRDRYNQGQLVHPHDRIAQTPHILVAVDFGHTTEELKQAILAAVRRYAESDKNSFFTVLTVVESNEFNDTEDVSELLGQACPTNIHRLMELRHWMKPLKLPISRINCQVIKGDAGEEIVSYAKYHVVDHIVIGARASSVMRRFIGSVSSKVVAEVNCTVTVVRSRQDRY